MIFTNQNGIQLKINKYTDSKFMQETKISHQPLRELLSLQSKQPSNLPQKLSQPCSNQYSGCQQCARNGPICPECSSRSQVENPAKKKQKSKIQPFTTKEVSLNQQARKSAENQNNSIMEKQKQTIEEQKKFEQSGANLKISNAEVILKPLQPGQSKPPQLGQNKSEQLAQGKHSQLAQNKHPQLVQNKPPLLAQNKSQQPVQNKPPLLNQNKPEFNHNVAKYGQIDVEIRFIVNKPRNSTPLQAAPPLIKPTSSQVLEIIQLKNLRQTQVQIPTANTIPLKQQTSILLNNEPVEIKHLNTSSVRFRAQSQPKISETKSVYDHKNYPNYDMDFNINHISPLPLRFQKIVEERSQIQKLISVGNSDRNPNPNDFNMSDNMERSEVQQFHGYRLQNINQQTPKKQIVFLPEVLEIKTSQVEEKPTQKTQSESFEIKKYLQDADWLAHMGEVEEGKEAKYIITFMLQFVFIYFNFHFSLKSPKGQCMDSSHGLNFFILRPWLLGSALADSTLTIIMLSVIILYVAKIIHAQKFQKFEHLAGLVWVGKMLVWTLALTALMLQSLKGSCSADILAFGIGSIVIQTVIMVILLVRKCEQPEEQDQQSEQP